MRKGNNAISAIESLTVQSATAKDTQSGETGPAPKSGSISFAQETSFDGSSPASADENAMVKNIAVSSEEPIKVEASGARHHAPDRRRSKIETSISCATRKAMPEPSAMRRVTAG